MSDITLDQGDCLECLGRLADGSIDLVITSPPYNLGGEPWPHLGHWKPGNQGSGGNSKWKSGSDACGGVQYGEHGDDMPHEDYVAWQQAVLRECWRVLADDGAIFYNHKPRVVGTKLWLPLELNPGLPLRQIIIWARSGGINFSPTAYVPIHEWIMVIAKERFRLRDKAASGLGDVWRIHQEINNPHPAPFPVELPRRILETTTGRVVLDPFVGSGTTLVACVEEGRKGLGFDISEANIALAEKRVFDAVMRRERPHAPPLRLKPEPVGRSLFDAFTEAS